MSKAHELFFEHAAQMQQQMPHATLTEIAAAIAVKRTDELMQMAKQVELAALETTDLSRQIDFLVSQRDEARAQCTCRRAGSRNASRVRGILRSTRKPRFAVAV